ncbi:hypothetical protein BGZ76_003856 [Entomortierella beljakovae]|nr:hypothetical protein BGZ76_003856 [Entomortierella beljakovae]
MSKPLMINVIHVSTSSRWIIQRKIPYFNAYDELPADMKRRLGYGYQTALLPSVNTIGSFHFVMKGLIIRFINVYKLELSMPNMPSLIFRFVQELALPIEVYPCALRLSRLLFETVDRKAKYKVHKESWVPIVTMACVVIVAKLIFGLDGKDRSAINHLSWTNSFPKESDWMRSLDVFGSVKSQSSIPGFFGEFEELIQVNPDIYSEYCKLAIRPIPEPVFRQVVGIVQSTEYAKETEDSSLNKDISLSIETFIKNLHSNVQPPERRSDMDSEEPPPLRPGEGYVHYKKDNVDVYLGRYERLLGYASNILYIKPKTLEFEISFIENRLFSVSNIMQPLMMTRYHRRIRRAKLRGRSELDIFQWDKHQFAKKDFTIPESYDTLDRIDYSKVSREEFIDQYEEKCLPVVIRGVMEGWGACDNWNPETFLRKYGSQPFKIGEDDDGNNVYIKMKYFLKYAVTDGLKDDSPLYIFDSGFVKRKLTPIQKERMTGSGSSSSSSSEKTTKGITKQRGNSPSSEEETNIVGNKRTRSRSNSPTNPKKIVRTFGKRPTVNESADPSLPTEEPPKSEQEHASTLLDDFMIPKYFKDDLFQYVGIVNRKLAGDRRRPPFRWFVVGGARSGTGIHIDPLGTSAWNTLTTGHKRWCLFPPGIPRDVFDPPMKPFDREAVSWFHHVYPRFAENDFELGKKYGMIQVIQGPGETMFVPGGWPHIVMNLDFTIAITQNFCSPTNFESVWLNTRHARPKLARKFQSEIERMYNKTSRCFYKDLLDKCRSLAYVPMLRMSTDDSSSSSSSSSSDSSGNLSSTDSESDIGEICMCHKSPDDQPVGRIKIGSFGKMKESFHYIYRGKNVIGSDPTVAHIYLDCRELNLANIHLKIKVNNYGVIFAMDYPKSASIIRSTVEDMEMEPGHWFEFGIHRKIKLVGAIVCERVEFSEDELSADTRRCIVRADFINQGIPKTDVKYRSQAVFVTPNAPSSRQPANSQPVPDNALVANSVASTWTMEDLTIPMEDGCSISPSSSIDSYTSVRPIGNILAHDLVSRRNTVIQSSNNEVAIDHDAATQLLQDSAELDMATQLFNPVDETQSISVDLGDETQSPVCLASSLDSTSIEDLSTSKGDAAGSFPPEEARSHSVVPMSQEISQVLSTASSEREYIPATPVELMANEDSGESPKRPRRLIVEEKEDEDEKVSQTPEPEHEAVSESPVKETNLDINFSETEPLTTPVGIPVDASNLIVNLNEDTRDLSAIVSRDSQLLDSGLEGTGSRYNPSSSSTTNVKVNGEPIRNQKRLLNPILLDSQEPAPSSAQGKDILNQDDGVKYQESPGQDSPQSSSQNSIRTKEGSPKHRKDSDAEDHSPKPSKQMRTKRTSDPSSANWRAAPSRTLSKRSTSDFGSSKLAVMLSAPMLNPKEKTTLMQTIANCGGSFKDNYKGANVLVFDGTIRTAKLMCAIAKSIPVVSLDWLNKTNNLRFEPKMSKSNADKGIEIFKDYTFHILKGKKKKGSVEGLTAKIVEDIGLMVEACGGKVIKAEPKQSDKCIIIGPDGYSADAQKFAERGYTVMKAEFIMTSIIEQKLDFTMHRIEYQEDVK